MEAELFGFEELSRRSEIISWEIGAGPKGHA